MDIGAFTAHETHLHCSCHDEVYVCEELRTLVPSGGTFGFDVIVHVGWALFVRCLDTQQVVHEMARLNISISHREVCFLGKKFVAYLAQAHREARGEMRTQMQQRGGYILHVDGTCEGDSPHLFCGLDELSNLVLDSIKIPSEKKERLVPFFQEIKARYGTPVALVHDMGRGILAAVQEVFPGVPDFICHFHFLRDIGKDLFEKQYKIIFDRLKKHGIRAALRRMLRSLEQRISTDDDTVENFKTDFEKGSLELSRFEQVPIIATYSLIRWIFDAAASLDGYGFPFDCPNLALYQRIVAVYDILNQVRDTLLTGRYRDNKPFFQLRGLLDKLIKDKKLGSAVAAMEETRPVFEDLRLALRIAPLGAKTGLNDDGEGNSRELKSIKEAVTCFRDALKRRQQSDPRPEYDKMLAQIDKYWDKLFADPITLQTPCGTITVTPQRTNNILERFFRDLKRNGRKKTGSSSLNKMLRAILADTPLISNLKSDDYMKLILKGCDSLAQRFSSIDAAEIREYLKQQQPDSSILASRIKPIIKSSDLTQKLPRMIQNAKSA